jgi:hypothetical protein
MKASAAFGVARDPFLYAGELQLLLRDLRSQIDLVFKLCADRAMRVLTSADRKMLADARSLRTRGEDLSESHIRVLALYDQALEVARTQACDEGVQIIVLPSGGE